MWGKIPIFPGRLFFNEVNSPPDHYTRSKVLYGRNVALYKFTLARSLFDFSNHAGDLSWQNRKYNSTVHQAQLNGESRSVSNSSTTWNCHVDHGR